MKKLGFGVIGLIFISGIYYLTAGSVQLTAEIKAQVDSELVSIQTQGFSVQDRKIEEKKEHFVLSFDKPKKIAVFFTKNGAKLSEDDAKVLQGLKIGIDLNYLPDTYSAISIDMYPLALPTAITQAVKDEEDKKILLQVEKMLEKKALLIHLDINKLGSSFKGHLKDINETFQGEENVQLILSKLKFTGDIKDDKLQGVKQTLKELSIHVQNKLTMAMHNLTSDYSLTGATPYDYTTNYSIEKMLLQAEDKLNVQMNNFELSSDSTVKDTLANGTFKTNVKNVVIEEKGNKTTLDNIVFEMKADNLDLKAFEKLEQIDVNNEKEINLVLQQLISQGIRFEIPTFSIENIQNAGKKMGGFMLSALFDIDKSLNITAVQNNPLAAINALNATIDLSLSSGVFTQLAQRPEAVMAMMLFQPKDVGG
ncbi:MAG: DUF945 family protein [Sulfurovum sp.]|nr:DUF945 family protein [Sulfurovum sp.]